MVVCDFCWIHSCRTHKKMPSYEKLTVPEGDNPPPHSQTSTCYMCKAMPAGIMLIELGFREQYFCVEMFVCENTRLGIPVNKHVSMSACMQKLMSPWNIKKMWSLKNNIWTIWCSFFQLKLLFVDECERCKDLIHVHSFAHDFHLRCIQSCMQPAQNTQSIFPPQYHLTGFLRDFMQVYPYPPKFSRNYLSEGTFYNQWSLNSLWRLLDLIKWNHIALTIELLILTEWIFSISLQTAFYICPLPPIKESYFLFSFSVTDTVSISNLSTNGSDLYTFMVQNNKLNDLKKFDMIPSVDPEIDNVNICFKKMLN